MPEPRERLSNFRRFFQPSEVAEEKRAESLRDARQCVSTETWRSLKDSMRHNARSTRWKSGMSSESAASNLIAQTIYLEVADEMDKIERMVREMADG